MTIYESFKLSAHELTYSGNKDGLRNLKEQFKIHNALCLVKIFNEEMLRSLRKGIKKLTFTETKYDVGTEEVDRHSSLIRIIEFTLCQPDFMAFIREVTGCHSIQFFRGRFYKMSDVNHHFNWHDDLSENNRVLGLSVNLSISPYDGGVFQIRKKSSHQVLYECANTGFGNALLFKISDKLCHRVTPVVGTNPKIAFAGWFKS